MRCLRWRKLPTKSVSVARRRNLAHFLRPLFAARASTDAPEREKKSTGGEDGAVQFAEQERVDAR